MRSPLVLSFAAGRSTETYEAFLREQGLLPLDPPEEPWETLGFSGGGGTLRPGEESVTANLRRLAEEAKAREAAAIAAAAYSEGEDGMQESSDPEGYERLKRNRAERAALMLAAGTYRGHGQVASAWGGLSLYDGGGGGGGVGCSGGSGGASSGGGRLDDWASSPGMLVGDGGSGGAGSGGIFAQSARWSLEDFDLDMSGVGAADGADNSDGRGGPPVPLAPLAAAGGAAMELGRWGEAAVTEYLIRRYPDDRVDWVNRDVESLLPYDVILRRRLAQGSGGADGASAGEADGEVLYVEVKTTGVADKRAFELSLSELRFALGHPGAYHIYRVLLRHADGDIDGAAAAGDGGGRVDAGRPAARVRVVKDLVAALGASPPLAKLLVQLE
jgi:hypothetical protein